MKQVKAVIQCGVDYMVDKITHSVTDNEFEAFIDDHAIKALGPINGGYVLQRGLAFVHWTSGGESVHILEMIIPDDDFSKAAVRRLAKQYQEQFHQEATILEFIEAEIEYVR